ncbi:MAG: ROK family protein [Oscillospiraceae bacterium]|nr:ROK family protein [Oscillospiraceae bacterium]
MSKYYIGVDLGGTNIAAGIVDKNGEIICKKSVRTNLPKPEAELENDILGLCKSLCEENGYALDKEIICVGIGTPGSVDGKRGIVWSNVNFGYENWKIKENLEKLFGLSVYVENDANAAIIAEVMAGNAKGCNNALIVTLGTGVGGGAFLNGEIYAGSNYAGLEVGHIVIEKDGRLCNCGRKGCFERYAAASALTRDTQAAMREHPESAMWEICPDIEKVNAKTAFDGQKQGDKVASDVVNTYIEYLACGLVNLINIFQPEVVCLGGGVSNERQYLLDLLQPHIDREDFARNARERTKIVIAKFRNDAGIIGAAMVGVNND